MIGFVMLCCVITALPGEIFGMSLTGLYGTKNLTIPAMVLREGEQNI